MGCLTLRLVTGALTAVTALLVATATLSITLTVTESAINTLGERYVTTTAHVAAAHTGGYLRRAERQIRLFQNISTDDGMRVPTDYHDAGRYAEFMHNWSFIGWQAFMLTTEQGGPRFTCFKDGSMMAVFGASDIPNATDLFSHVHVITGWHEDPLNASSNFTQRHHIWSTATNRQVDAGTLLPPGHLTFAWPNNDCRYDRFYPYARSVMQPGDLPTWSPRIFINRWLLQHRREVDFYLHVMAPLTLQDGTELGYTMVLFFMSAVRDFLVTLERTKGTHLFAYTNSRLMIASTVMDQPVTYEKRRASEAETVPDHCSYRDRDRLDGGCVYYVSEYAFTPLRDQASEPWLTPEGNAPIVRRRKSNFYAVLRVPLDYDRLRQVFVCVVLPVEDVMGEVDRGRLFAIVAAALIVVVASLSAFLALRFVLQPLQAVAEGMRRAANLEEDDTGSDRTSEAPEAGLVGVLHRAAAAVGCGKDDEGMAFDPDAPPALSTMDEVHQLQAAYRTLHMEIRRIRAFVPQSLLAENEGRRQQVGLRSRGSVDGRDDRRSEVESLFLMDIQGDQGQSPPQPNPLEAPQPTPSLYTAAWFGSSAPKPKAPADADALRRGPAPISAQAAWGQFLGQYPQLRHNPPPGQFAPAAPAADNGLAALATVGGPASMKKRSRPASLNGRQPKPASLQGSVASSVRSRGASPSRIGGPHAVDRGPGTPRKAHAAKTRTGPASDASDDALGRKVDAWQRREAAERERRKLAGESPPAALEMTSPDAGAPGVMGVVPVAAAQEEEMRQSGGSHTASHGSHPSASDGLGASLTTQAARRVTPPPAVAASCPLAPPAEPGSPPQVILRFDADGNALPPYRRKDASPAAEAPTGAGSLHLEDYVIDEAAERARAERASRQKQKEQAAREKQRDKDRKRRLKERPTAKASESDTGGATDGEVPQRDHTTTSSGTGASRRPGSTKSFFEEDDDDGPAGLAQLARRATVQPRPQRGLGHAGLRMENVTVLVVNLRGFHNAVSAFSAPPVPAAGAGLSVLQSLGLDSAVPVPDFLPGGAAASAQEADGANGLSPPQLQHIHGAAQRASAATATGAFPVLWREHKVKTSAGVRERHVNFSLPSRGSDEAKRPSGPLHGCDGGGGNPLQQSMSSSSSHAASSNSGDRGRPPMERSAPAAVDPAVVEQEALSDVLALTPGEKLQVIRAMFDRAVTVVTKAVKDCDGFLDFFQGDRFVATFNAVKPCDVHQARAVMAAMQIAKALLDVAALTARDVLAKRAAAAKKDYDAFRALARPTTLLSTGGTMPDSSGGGAAGECDACGGVRPFGAAGDVPPFPTVADVAAMTHDQRRSDLYRIYAARRAHAQRHAAVREGVTAQIGCGVTSGVASGRALVGNVGSRHVKRFAVVGAAYSQAVCLERMCRLYPCDAADAVLSRGLFEPSADGTDGTTVSGQSAQSHSDGRRCTCTDSGHDMTFEVAATLMGSDAASAAVTAHVPSQAPSFRRDTEESPLGKGTSSGETRSFVLRPGLPDHGTSLTAMPPPPVFGRLREPVCLVPQWAFVKVAPHCTLRVVDAVRLPFTSAPRAVASVFPMLGDAADDDAWLYEDQTGRSGSAASNARTRFQVVTRLASGDFAGARDAIRAAAVEAMPEGEAPAYAAALPTAAASSAPDLRATVGALRAGMANALLRHDPAAPLVFERLSTGQLTQVTTTLSSSRSLDGRRSLGLLSSDSAQARKGSSNTSTPAMTENTRLPHDSAAKDAEPKEHKKDVLSCATCAPPGCVLDGVVRAAQSQVLHRLLSADTAASRLPGWERLATVATAVSPTALRALEYAVLHHHLALACDPQLPMLFAACEDEAWRVLVAAADAVPSSPAQSPSGSGAPQAPWPSGAVLPPFHPTPRPCEPPTPPSFMRREMAAFTAAGIGLDAPHVHAQLRQEAQPHIAGQSVQELIRVVRDLARLHRDGGGDQGTTPRLLELLQGGEDEAIAGLLQHLELATQCVLWATVMRGVHSVLRRGWAPPAEWAEDGTAERLSLHSAAATLGLGRTPSAQGRRHSQPLGWALRCSSCDSGTGVSAAQVSAAQLETARRVQSFALPELLVANDTLADAAVLLDSKAAGVEPRPETAAAQRVELSHPGAAVAAVRSAAADSAPDRDGHPSSTSPPAASRVGGVAREALVGHSLRHGDLGLFFDSLLPGADGSSVRHAPLRL